MSHTASIANCLIAPTLRLVLQSAAGCRTPSSLITPVAVWQHPAVTHQVSAKLAPLEQATMMLNDSNAISCTVHVFAGNEAAPFPGIRERKMTGIPGRPGNGRPGMKTLLRCHCEAFNNWSSAAWKLLAPSHDWVLGTMQMQMVDDVPLQKTLSADSHRPSTPELVR